MLAALVSASLTPVCRVLAIVDRGRSVGQFWSNVGQFQSDSLRFGPRGSAAVGSGVLGLINTKDTPMIRVKSIGHGRHGHLMEPMTIQLIKYQLTNN